MRIINKTNGLVLAEDIVIAKTPFKRMLGLLMRREFHRGQALILKPCNSIHTFFMGFPIDVLFIDKNNRIVKTLPNLKSFRLSGIYFNAILAIELPTGTILSTSTQEGDTLLFD
ncbi:MAG: DUF192 domain-containing protein [Candidatus Omnitrophica bacterium]|nr:DUF192 domain-containing protein [Candidatus Omnitrophota bacterium]